MSQGLLDIPVEGARLGGFLGFLCRQPPMLPMRTASGARRGFYVVSAFQFSSGARRHRERLCPSPRRAPEIPYCWRGLRMAIMSPLRPADSALPVKARCAAPLRTSTATMSPRFTSRRHHELRQVDFRSRGDNAHRRSCRQPGQRVSGHVTGNRKTARRFHADLAGADRLPASLEFRPPPHAAWGPISATRAQTPKRWLPP